MKSRRLVASIALAAAVVLGTTGCNFIAPQATTMEYSAGDGINVPASGPLEVRNVLIIANEDGSEGNLIAAVVNDTPSAETLNIEIVDSESLAIRVPAETVASFGAFEEPIFIADLGALPGSTVEVYFQSGSANGVSIQIPVLDGTLPYYADLAP